MTPAIVFDDVSKKFSRGERHDSLRDLVPSLVRKFFRPAPADRLGAEEFWALRNVSFEVQSGEALGIIGSNGAGKSTCLKVLTRILKPTSGRSHTSGRVGALIEVAAGFHPDLTGRENVFLQGAIMGMKRADIVRRFDEIVEFSEIRDFVDTPVKRYSSGMNARLGFSIAAHLDPDVLIIDEVLSVGDMLFQQKCYSRMKAFLDQGTAVVFVSHNLAAVSQLCSHALMLTHGQVSAFGAPGSVIGEYVRNQTPGSGSAGSAIDVGLVFSDRRSRDGGVFESGQTIRFEVHLSCHVPFRGIIGVVVWDLARNLYVYGAASESAGLPALDYSPGDKAVFEFELKANLARGTYTVEINLFDTTQQTHVARVNSAGTFTINEQSTYQSVANLFLAGADITQRVDQPPQEQHHLAKQR